MIQSENPSPAPLAISEYKVPDSVFFFFFFEQKETLYMALKNITTEFQTNAVNPRLKEIRPFRSHKESTCIYTVKIGGLGKLL